jgi:beta-mannosidase
MNMVRVWGGGVYEDDRFYELCDSLGLMVWQDFMFACAMYPGDSAFLENVRLEAIDNYNRLKKHTSLVLWCGNNENLAAWKRWGWESTAVKDQTQKVADKIWRHYDTLFHHILPKVVYDNHPEHGFGRNNNWPDYWSSSPSAKEGIPESYKIGDTHYWGVWWGKEPFENYNTKISSFMSEYGFQSFPEYSTFKQFAKQKDEDMYSEVMKYHQRSSIGNATIEEYMAREFKNPKDFESLLYLSQLLQGDGIQTAIEAHRRNKATCMGSLYWQLNDCWPGASWSSIDYYGKWKALHYKVRDAFKPVIVSQEFLDSNLNVIVVSDIKESLECEVEIKLLNFNSEIPIKKWNQQLKIKPFESLTVKSLAAEELNENKNDTYVKLILKNKGNIISSKNIFFLPNKELKLPKPNLTFEVNIDSSLNKLYVKIKSNYFAKGVNIRTSSKLNFSENYFDLDANQEKTVSIDLLPNENLDRLIKSIKFNSLWSSSH